jgi:hypothetical protein
MASILEFIGIFSHAFVDIFAGGRSDIKVYLFPIFLLILAGIIFCVRKDYSSHSRIAVRIFWSCLVTGYIVGLALFIFFCTQYDLRFRDFLMTINGGEISSTQINHNHVLKGSFGLVLLSIGQKFFENLDAGTAFVDLIPNWALIMGFILIVICVLSTIALFMSTIHSKTSQRQKIFYSLAYAIGFFSLLKSVPDGGIFSAVTLPVLAAVIFGLSPTRKNAVISITLMVTYLLCVWIQLSTDIFLTTTDAFKFAVQGATACALVSLLFHLSSVEKIKRIDVLLVIFVAILIGQSIYTEVSKTYEYRRLSARGGIIALYTDPIQGENLIYKIGELSFYRIENDVSVSQLVRTHGLLDNIYPVAIPWSTCIPKDRQDLYRFNVTGPQEYHMGQGQVPASIMVKPQGMSGQGWFVYQVTITVKPCMPRHVNLIEEILRQNFGDTLIVSKLEQL